MKAASYLCIQTFPKITLFAAASVKLLVILVGCNDGVEPMRVVAASNYYIDTLWSEPEASVTITITPFGAFGPVAVRYDHKLEGPDLLWVYIPLLPDGLYIVTIYVDVPDNRETGNNHDYVLTRVLVLKQNRFVVRGQP